MKTLTKIVTALLFCIALIASPAMAATSGQTVVSGTLASTLELTADATATLPALVPGASSNGGSAIQYKSNVPANVGFAVSNSGKLTTTGGVSLASVLYLGIVSGTCDKSVSGTLFTALPAVSTLTSKNVYYIQPVGTGDLGGAYSATITYTISASP